MRPILPAILWIALATGLAGAEALEIGPADLDHLPKGKEADGIIGDFVLRNDRVEALVSANTPGRKAQFLGVDGTSRPNLGPNNRAHGCLDQYHSETGRFEVQVPPGKYRVIITRGIEFSHWSGGVSVGEGQTQAVQATLRRRVDSAGWVSADFHNHSTPSGDGESFDLRTGYGSSAQSRLKPCAYNNPIFVDVNGGGFQPNGDTLGWELPVKGLSVDEARQLLKRHAEARP